MEPKKANNKRTELTDTELYLPETGREGRGHTDQKVRKMGKDGQRIQTSIYEVSLRDIIYSMITIVNNSVYLKVAKSNILKVPTVRKKILFGDGYYLDLR